VTARREAPEETPPNGPPVREGAELDTTTCNDLVEQRRKRTKYFCVSRNLYTSILTSKVNRKGPTVATIRVFPTKADDGKVMLRINVYDDGHFDEMLSFGFWPSFVTCKRWRSRTSRGTRPALFDRGRDIPP